MVSCSLCSITGSASIIFTKGINNLIYQSQFINTCLVELLIINISFNVNQG